MVLENASLVPEDYSDSSQRGTLGSKSSEFSSTKGRVLGVSGSKNSIHHKGISNIKKPSGGQSVVQTAFTNFTESLSASSEEYQDAMQKTFSSIVTSFSRDLTGSSESGYDESENSSRYTSASSGNGKLRGWSEFVLPEGLRSRVSSLTSRTSSSQSNTTNSSLSSRSASVGMQSENVHITVDNGAFVIRDSSEESSTSSSSTGVSEEEASWQGSRDVSLLDTIGEGGSQEEESGSENGSSQHDNEERDGDILYDYDDDSTEFNSDVGLDDLGAVMLQIGSCHFEPESVSQSFEDDYSYTSGMFPPVISNFMGGTDNHEGVTPGNPIFHSRKRKMKNGQNQQQSQQNALTSLFVSKRMNVLHGNVVAITLTSHDIPRPCAPTE